MTQQSTTEGARVDAVVVGAGFAGLFMVYRLRALGMSVQGIERAPGVGGTWHWNRYPGARCDIESLDYCYGFDDELLADWRWTERYAAQPEILAYLEHVADRFDLRPHFEFNTSATSAIWDESTTTWVVTTDRGETLVCSYLIMATGNLSRPQRPAIEGLDDFAGTWVHTGDWPTEPVDLEGKRVAVVGTGSSGIQTCTAIAPIVSELYVFQRTPNYSMPAQNRQLSEDEVAEVLANYRERRTICEWSDAGTPLPDPTESALSVSADERRRRYEEGWQMGGISSLSFAFNDMFRSEEANLFAQDFAREQIRSIVEDPDVADLLSPHHHIGTKRTCVDTGYYEIYNRPNVHLIDLKTDPIVRLTSDGIQTSSQHMAVDVIIFAIGFDAITGAMAEIDIRGVDGVSLKQAWADGPVGYLGVQVAGFPNLFTITGPGSPSVLSNMVISIEQHVDWIADALNYLREHGLTRIEADADAQSRWMNHVVKLANSTLYPKAKSWYLGANIPGRERLFSIYIAGCGPFRAECNRIVEAGYEGFVLTPGSSQKEAAHV
jgi:cyclohexanone monooxygenase